jgi:hypothetical protein
VPFDPHTGESPAPGQRYSLRALVKASNPGIRRKEIALRPIQPTQALAADLYARCYKPIVTTITEALPAIVAAYDAGLPVRDGLIHDSTDAAQQQTQSLGDHLQRLVLTLLPGLRDWSTRTEAWHRGQWRGAALTATGVDLDTVLIGSGQPQSIAEYMAWNAALMKDVAAQATQKISSAVFAAYQARQPASDLAASLRDIAGFSRRRSLGIASDQLSKLSSALDRERMAEAGIEAYRWRHSGKLHPRKWHLARNNHEFDLRTGEEIGGSDVVEPGDEPGQAPFCGCRRQAILHLD